MDNLLRSAWVTHPEHWRYNDAPAAEKKNIANSFDGETNISKDYGKEEPGQPVHYCKNCHFLMSFFFKK